MGQEGSSSKSTISKGERHSTERKERETERGAELRGNRKSLDQREKDSERETETRWKTEGCGRSTVAEWPWHAWVERTVAGIAMQHREPIDSPKGALKRNTSYDIISDFGEKCSNQSTCKHLKVKRGARKYNFDLKENHSSIIHRNQKEKLYARGSFN